MVLLKSSKLCQCLVVLVDSCKIYNKPDWRIIMCNKIRKLNLSVEISLPDLGLANQTLIHRFKLVEP